MSTPSQPSSGDKPVVSTGTMEVAVSLAFLAVGALFMWDSVRLGSGWADDGPEAGYFPFYISLIMMVAAAANILFTLLGQEAKATNAKPFVMWSQFRSVLAVFFPVLVFVTAIQYLGLYVSALLFIGAFMRINGKYGLKKILPIAVLVPVVIYVMFEKWFLVPLPKGPLEALLGL